jgi:hypothetical protein
MAFAAIGVASAIERSAILRSSAFAALIASGPFIAMSVRYLFTLSMSSAAGTTAWTRPISRAYAASKRRPVTNSSRAADRPIFAST